MEMLTSALPTRPDEGVPVTVCESCDFARGHRTGEIRPYVLHDGQVIVLCDDCMSPGADLVMLITWTRYASVLAGECDTAEFERAHDGSVFA